MARGKKHLWLGDWQQHVEDGEPDVEAAAPPPAPADPPTRARVSRRTAKRRTRAWVVAAALGSAAFAWSFGYILGEVRADTDPGLKRLSKPTAAVRQERPSQQQVPQQPQTQPPGFQTAPGQGLPPVTTRQS